MIYSKDQQVIVTSVKRFIFLNKHSYKCSSGGRMTKANKQELKANWLLVAPEVLTKWKS